MVQAELVSLCVCVRLYGSGVFRRQLGVRPRDGGSVVA